jgi:hypothetical protein
MTRCLALTLLFAAAAVAAPFETGPDGAWRLAAAGLPEVRGSLFLWHDNWQYAVAKDGSLPGSAAGAKIAVQAAGRVEGDQLTLTYTFRRDAATTLNSGLYLMVELPLEPLAKRAMRFSQGESALVGGGVSGQGDGFAVNLSDTRALRLKVDRLVSVQRRTDAPDRVLLNVRLLPPDFPAGVDVPVTITVSLEPAGSDRLPWQVEARAPLALRGARFGAESVPVNQGAVLDVDLAGTYDNPYDPDQIALDAVITRPDGSRFSLPGFWQQPFREVAGDGLHGLAAAGAPGWQVRFTPTAPGPWKVALTARQGAATVTLDGPTLTATDSKAPGFIHIGRHHNVFVRDGAGSLFLIGHNVPTYLSGAVGMAETFDKMAAGGENFTRMWMYSGAMGLEWGQPVGTYRQGEAWRLDHALELANARGISIMLCLDTHQDYLNGNFVQNPYNVARGGPLKAPLEFFTNETARKLYRQRLRYLVGRWSGATNLVAWEFVNEIEGWQGFDQHKDVVAAWHSAMAAVLHGLDPYQHPVTTSCWTTEGHPTLWNAPGIDFVQTHHYANTRVDMAQRTVEVCAAKRRDYPGRLHLFGEMGINSGFHTGFGDDEDPSGVHLHNQSWAALLAGCASVPCNWWHETYFVKHDLFHVFRGISRFAAALPLERDWRPVEGLKLDWVTPPAHPVADDLDFAGSYGSWAAPPKVRRWTLGRDGKIADLDQLPALLHGSNHPDLRIPLTFDVDMPADGRLLVMVGRCSNSPRLVAEVDGRQVLDHPLPCAAGLGKESRYVEQWKLWETLYDEEIAIPLPAGRHTVALRNTGGDWITLSGFRLPGYVTNAGPRAAAQGLSDGRELALWVRNTRHWWLPVARGDAIPPLDPLRLTIPAGLLPPGAYRLEQWNTESGAVERTDTVTVSADGARLDLPAIATDVALRLR